MKRIRNTRGDNKRYRMVGDVYEQIAALTPCITLDKFNCEDLLTDDFLAIPENRTCCQCGRKLKMEDRVVSKVYLFYSVTRGSFGYICPYCSILIGKTVNIERRWTKEHHVIFPEFIKEKVKVLMLLARRPKVVFDKNIMSVICQQIVSYTQGEMQNTEILGTLDIPIRIEQTFIDKVLKTRRSIHRTNKGYTVKFITQYVGESEINTMFLM
jgi:hypothetical protein